MSSGADGIDHHFAPDQTVKDGQSITGPNWSLYVHHSPGPLADHICLNLWNILFMGDQIMEWSSSMSTLPCTDMGRYMKSLERLERLVSQIILPSYGTASESSEKIITTLLAHRIRRETQILGARHQRPKNIKQLVSHIYPPLSPRLQQAAP
ncbi:MAG: hypothetical protein QMB16_01485 [Paracoccaceae bacterium]